MSSGRTLIVDDGLKIRYACPSCTTEIVIIKMAESLLPMVVLEHHRERHPTAKLPDEICALLAKRRPSYYGSLKPREQWKIDRELGILDWKGPIQ